MILCRITFVINQMLKTDIFVINKSNNYKNVIEIKYNDAHTLFENEIVQTILGKDLNLITRSTFKLKVVIYKF